MNLQLIKFPDPILQERMPEFDFNNPIVDPVELEKNMIQFMFDHNGMGLSANQVGIRTRVFTIGTKDYPEAAQAFFNPIVEEAIDDFDDLEEGCLSFPGIFVKVKRPKIIRVRWQTSKGDWQKAEITEYTAKCFLHELDHLEGITFRDRVSQLRWEVSLKKTVKKLKRAKTQATILNNRSKVSLKGKVA